MFAIVQQLFPFVFGIAWLGGSFALLLRARAKQNEYLRHFERDVPFFAGDPLFIPASPQAYRDLVRVMKQRQSDPVLEQLRRDFQRRFLYMYLWGFGLPIVGIGAIAIAIAIGVVR